MNGMQHLNETKEIRRAFNVLRCGLRLVMLIERAAN